MWLGTAQGAVFAEHTELHCWARCSGEPQGARSWESPIPRACCVCPGAAHPTAFVGLLSQAPAKVGGFTCGQCFLSFLSGFGAVVHLNIFLSPGFLLFCSDPTFGKRNFEPMLTVELCGTAGRTGFEFFTFAKFSSRRGLVYPKFSLEASVPAYPAKGAPSSPSHCRHRRLPVHCHI